VAERNCVTPFGEIVANQQRGLFMATARASTATARLSARGRFGGGSRACSKFNRSGRPAPGRRVDPMDRRLHADLHVIAWRDLPIGALVAVDAPALPALEAVSSHRFPVCGGADAGQIV